MPDQHAGDDFDDDLEVRRKVIRAVRSYIGQHPWSQRIPLQSNEKPSVLFMKQDLSALELRGSQHKHHLPSREEDRFHLHQGEEEMANAEEAGEKLKK